MRKSTQVTIARPTGFVSVVAGFFTLPASFSEFRCVSFDIKKFSSIGISG